MPIAILPDVDEQRCIGCALCVEICTALGPDVLRVKPVEGWKRGKAFVFYPERCISDGACVGVCPTQSERASTSLRDSETAATVRDYGGA